MYFTYIFFTPPTTVDFFIYLGAYGYVRGRTCLPGSALTVYVIVLSRSVISGFKVVDMVIGFFWEIIFQKMYLLNLEKAYLLSLIHI